jgi:hypothetical protein
MERRLTSPSHFCLTFASLRLRGRSLFRSGSSSLAGNHSPAKAPRKPHSVLESQNPYPPDPIEPGSFARNAPTVLERCGPTKRFLAKHPSPASTCRSREREHYSSRPGRGSYSVKTKSVLTACGLPQGPKFPRRGKEPPPRFRRRGKPAVVDQPYSIAPVEGFSSNYDLTQA